MARVFGVRELLDVFTECGPAVVTYPDGSSVDVSPRIVDLAARFEDATGSPPLALWAGHDFAHALVRPYVRSPERYLRRRFGHALPRQERRLIRRSMRSAWHRGGKLRIDLAGADHLNLFTFFGGIGG